MELYACDKGCGRDSAYPGTCEECAQREWIQRGSSTDCRSETGEVVGVVDAIITLSRVFGEKVMETTLGSTEEVRAALLDLEADEGFKVLLHEMIHAKIRKAKEAPVPRDEDLATLLMAPLAPSREPAGYQCAHCGSLNIKPSPITGNPLCDDCGEEKVVTTEEE
jgi:hypothetical protein